MKIITYPFMIRYIKVCAFAFSQIMLSRHNLRWIFKSHFSLIVSQIAVQFTKANFLIIPENNFRVSFIQEERKFFNDLFSLMNFKAWKYFLIQRLNFTCDIFNKNLKLNFGESNQSTISFVTIIQIKNYFSVLVQQIDIQLH